MRPAGNSNLETIAVEGTAKRRHRSKQERRQIAQESLQAGASVAVVARRHGVNANQVFHWRKLLGEGRLDVTPAPAQLMPVRITEMIEDRSGAVRQQAGIIQIEVGRVRVRVEGSVDREALRMVLEQLGR
jgi:transposase